jgi:hypothetical protein
MKSEAKKSGLTTEVRLEMRLKLGAKLVVFVTVADKNLVLRHLVISPLLELSVPNTFHVFPQHHLLPAIVELGCPAVRVIRNVLCRIQCLHLPQEKELTRSRERSEASTCQRPRLSLIADKASWRHQSSSLSEYQACGSSRGLSGRVDQ